MERIVRICMENKSHKLKITARIKNAQKSAKRMLNCFGSGHEWYSISPRYLTSSRISSWTREDIIHIHKRACLLYEHQWKRRDLLCNHNDGDLFTCEDICHFHEWRYHVFARKLTWYFTGVYTIKNPYPCEVSRSHMWLSYNQVFCFVYLSGYLSIWFNFQERFKILFICLFSI